MSIWSELYKSDKMPNFKQIDQYINTPLFDELCKFIEDTYKVEPSIEHSTCSMQPGWNIKYKKSSKSICTLYPEENYFTCMVTINSRMQDKVEYMLPSCDNHIQEVYQTASPFNGTKWLMIDVKNDTVLKDIKELLELKMSIK